MKDTKGLRRELDQQVSRLSEDRLQEVLDFVGYLLQKEKAHQTEPAQPLPPEQKSILDLIGTVHEAPFAHSIDEALYESQPMPDTALEDVRQRLAKIKGSMSDTIRSMRDERG